MSIVSGPGRPYCSACGESAPYGDARIPWMRWHTGWMHETWWAFKSPDSFTPEQRARIADGLLDAAWGYLSDAHERALRQGDDALAAATLRAMGATVEAAGHLDPWGDDS